MKLPEPFKDEIKASVLIGFFATLFNAFLISNGFVQFALYAPIGIILFNYSMTRKFEWKFTFIQVVLASAVFIYLYNFIFVFLILKWLLSSFELISLYEGLIKLIIFIPLFYFLVYVIIVSLVKYFSDAIMKKTGAKECV